MVTILRPIALGKDRWVTIADLVTGDVFATCLLGLMRVQIQIAIDEDTTVGIWTIECSKGYLYSPDSGKDERTLKGIGT